MPAMHFHLRWPDAHDMRCYSPSLVIHDHLAVGQRYPVAELRQRCREALGIASERVRAKYGFACSMAMDQLAQIEHTAAAYPDTALVEVLAFSDA
jgi:uncharacterized repeat protein (TIGR04042 family)